MPSKPVDTALRDILHHLELAANFSAGFDRASFKRDIKTLYAVTRCLEIISVGFAAASSERHWLVSRTRCGAKALLRRAGTPDFAETWTPDRQCTAHALRCIRGT